MKSSPIRVVVFSGILIALVLICLVLVTIVLPKQLQKLTAVTTDTTPTPEALGDVERSIQKVMADQANPMFLMYDAEIDYLTLSEDSNWATAQLTPRDPDTGEIIPSEPGLTIAVWDGDEWNTIMPSDPGWTDALLALPPDLISEEEREGWVMIASDEQALVSTEPLEGYHLPWAGGESMRLTQSVGHDRYTPNKSGHFSFDFATPGTSRIFNVHAAKEGFVKKAVWHHPNGSEGNSNSNYIILEDQTTTPWTYQLYLHLAQDSIPEALRKPGAPVKQGQFIGIADDTGVSSNHHLHFHVHTSPTSWWSRAVDITFQEVSINDGRPRISSDSFFCRSRDVCFQTQYTYESENYWTPEFKLFFPTIRE